VQEEVYRRRLISNCHGISLLHHAAKGLYGVGGTIKRLVANSINTRRYVVVDAVSFAAASCTNLKIITILTPQIADVVSQHQLSHWEEVLPLTGTVSIYYVIPTGHNLLDHVQTKLYSNSSTSTLHALKKDASIEIVSEGIPSSPNQDQPKVNRGDFVLVSFEVGKRTQICGSCPRC